jgi:hypothetical protein
VVAAASAAASGSAVRTTTATESPSRPQTRATYRTLLLKGLAPEEAANLTAYLCGIEVGAGQWKLNEVNRLLFLRELHESGAFGADDRGPTH